MGGGSFDLNVFQKRSLRIYVLEFVRAPLTLRELGSETNASVCFILDVRSFITRRGCVRRSLTHELGIG